MPKNDSSGTPPFELQFCRKCLGLLNQAVVRSTKDKDKEEKAIEAGKTIRKGEGNRRTLEVIFDWKSHRPKRWLAENEDDEIEAALNLARSDADLGEKIAALVKIKGVGVPMASAILTAMYPDRYTVIDVRALDTLGFRDRSNLERLYPEYLAYCRSKSTELGMSLRAFDRAIWMEGSAG